MLIIARALLAALKLFILNEQAVGIAPGIIDRIKDALWLLYTAMPFGVLLIEQNLDFAFALARREYVMEKSQIVLATPVADLHDAAIERYLAF